MVHFGMNCEDQLTSSPYLEFHYLSFSAAKSAELPTLCSWCMRSLSRNNIFCIANALGQVVLYFFFFFFFFFFFLMTITKLNQVMVSVKCSSYPYIFDYFLTPSCDSSANPSASVSVCGNPLCASGLL